jgi:5-methylcytosine-specific restriction endonuclease McrA
MQNRSEYPDNWSDVIRPRILIRDNYKCCKCGIAHRSYVLIDQSNKVIRIDKDEHDELLKEGKNTYRIFLQVSHKNNIKSDCSDENLWSLCNRCHAVFDREHKRLVRLSNPVTIVKPCVDKNCPFTALDHKHSYSGSMVYFKTQF